MRTVYSFCPDYIQELVFFEEDCEPIRVSSPKTRDEVVYFLSNNLTKTTRELLDFLGGTLVSPDVKEDYSIEYDGIIYQPIEKR